MPNPPPPYIQWKRDIPGATSQTYVMRGTTEDVVTVWWCESCNAKGAVTMATDAGVYEGFQRIWEAHALTEPSCRGGRDTVRVRIEGLEDAA